MSSDVHRWSSTVTSGPWPAPTYWTLSSPCRFFQSIEYFKLYKQEGLHEPEEILACTRDYKRQNDHLADFIHNCVDKKEGAFLSLNDGFLELKAWVNINFKMPTKSELDKYLSQNLTKCVCNNNFKGYKGFRLKNRYQLVDTEDYPE